MKNEEIVKVRDELREVLENQIKNEKRKNEQIGKIVFYENFEIINQNKDFLGLIENEVFIVTRNVFDENDNKIKFYEIYDEHQVLLAKTDENGKILYQEKYKEKLKQNFGKFYGKAGIEKQERYLVREGEFAVSEKKYDELNEKEKEEIRKNIQEKKIESFDEKELDNPEIAKKDLNLDDDDIVYSVEIKDKRFYTQVPSAKEYEGNAMLIYSKKAGQFMIGGMVNGHFVKNKYIDTAKSTLKSSIDLDRNGENVKEDKLTGVMIVKNNPNYAYAVNLENTGYIEFQELRIDRSGTTPCYISADLETTRQYRTSKEVEYMMRRDINHEISDEVDRFNNVDSEINDRKLDIEDIEEKKF